MSVFEGLDTVHGKYIMPKEVTPGQKAKGQGVTVQGGPTPSLWDLHLSGKQLLGVTPINKNNQCRFGVVDVDVYDLNIADIAKILAANKIPATIIRSKSGGPQIYVFTKEFVPAALMREKLEMIAAFMGFGTHEIFPKQTELMADKNDSGSWINMPYFERNQTMRYALTTEGKAMSAEEFLEHVKNTGITTEQLKNFKLELDVDLDDGPPCLQVMVRRGIPEGMRNIVLFNFGIYAKKKSPDGWEAILEQLNQKYFHPPLPGAEVQTIVKSHKKKNYHYGCDNCPLKTYCNSTLCRTRKFGVGGGEGRPVVGSLTILKTVPQIYFIDVTTDNGTKRMQLFVDDLVNQQRYQKRCVEAVKAMPQLVKNSIWSDVVNEMLKSAIEVEMPNDATPKGQFMEYLERFCSGQAQAKQADEILIGKPWLNDGKHYFRLVDLNMFLERQRYKGLTLAEIASVLRDIPGVEYGRKWIQKKNVHLWGIPEFGKYPENLKTPSQPDANVF